MYQNPHLCQNLTETPIIGQPLSDPGWYFLNLFKGGHEFDQRFASNSFNLIIPRKSVVSSNFFGARCRIQKRPDAVYTFKNRVGKELVLPNQIIKVGFACNSDSVQRTYDTLREIKIAAKTIDERPKLNRIATSVFIVDSLRFFNWKNVLKNVLR